MIRNTLIIALAVSCALTCALFPLPLAAQYSEPVAIEEIQVTATRRPTELRNVSAALSVITAEEIRDVKLTTDALAAQTGVYLQQTTPRQVDSKGRTQKLYDVFPDGLNHFRAVKGIMRLIKPDKYPDPRADIKSVIYPDWVGCSFLLINRQDFDAIGGWSDDYWLYAEDTDFCRRAHDMRLSVACTPAVTIIHTHGGSSRHSERVTALSKLEGVISKNVFTMRHSKGLRRFLNHLIIALLNLPVLSLAALLNVVTLKSVRALRLRGNIFSELVPYYWNALKTGVWLSPRALANKSQDTS